MISIEHLSVQFGGIFLFDDLSFAIKERDRIGLIGKNGAGKSSLLKILIGENLPEEGKISMPNKTTLGYLPQEMKVDYTRTVYNETATAFEEVLRLESKINELSQQIAEQTDYESDAYYKMLQDFNDAQERFQTLGGLTIREEVEKTLKGLGFINGEFDRPVSEFSGGWQMRIELAKTLLKQPSFILLDEPTNHLDIESIIWLEGFLKDYPGGVVLISHDREFLDKVTNRTIELVNGKMYDHRVSYGKFMELREQRREQQKTEAKRQEKYIEHTETLINKFRAKKNKAAFAQSLINKLDRLEKVNVEETEVGKIKITFPPAPRSGKVVVQAKRLSKSYGSLNVLNEIDFELERGQKVAFVGKNGEGKTTLSKIITSKTDWEGQIELGHNVSIGYFEQNQAETLDGNKTVFETIDDVATGDMRTKVRGLLGAFLFSGEDVDKKVMVLSGGEKTRLALAKLLLKPVNLLVLDEPTNHLDMRSKDILKQALLNFDGAMIIVSHDREFLKELTDKVFEFKDQKIKPYFGDVYDFLEQRKIQSLNELGFNKRSGGVSSQKLGKEERIKQREESKLQEKEIKKQKNKVRKCEQLIENTEAKIADTEKLMAEPDFYMKNPRSNEILQEYDQLKNQLKLAMEDWETQSEKLEEIQPN